MKRLFDLALTLLTMALWLPLLMLAILLVRLRLGAPVFFRQDRLGFNERPFKLIKLRTMRPGEGSDHQRLTRLGRWLRRTSLDELPELWHVLKGEMSLVGPRPLPLRYQPRYTRRQRLRHSVLPGITGWAQINGRNSLSWEEKFEHDLWYIANQSLALDCKIILLTIGAVLGQRGINAAATTTMDEFRGIETENGEINA